MTIKPPSYLILRNGIYYLQIRTPKRFANKRQCKPLLMRRSTRTGNLREALLIARKWTVELMAKEFDKTLTEIDHSSEQLDVLYSRGRAIFEKLSLVDPKDSLEIESFLDDLNPNDQKALSYYQDQQRSAQPIRTEVIRKAANILPQNILTLRDVLGKYLEADAKKAKP